MIFRALTVALAAASFFTPAPAFAEDPVVDAAAAFDRAVNSINGDVDRSLIEILAPPSASASSPVYSEAASSAQAGYPSRHRRN